MRVALIVWLIGVSMFALPLLLFYLLAALHSYFFPVVQCLECEGVRTMRRRQVREMAGAYVDRVDRDGGRVRRWLWVCPACDRELQRMAKATVEMKERGQGRG